MCASRAFSLSHINKKIKIKSFLIKVKKKKDIEQSIYGLGIAEAWDSVEGGGRELEKQVAPHDKCFYRLLPRSSVFIWWPTTGQLRLSSRDTLKYVCRTSTVHGYGRDCRQDTSHEPVLMSQGGPGSAPVMMMTVGVQKWGQIRETFRSQNCQGFLATDYGSEEDKAVKDHRDF